MKNRIKIISKERALNGDTWINGVYGGKFFQAKHCEELCPIHGIDGGKVYKLVVCDNTKWDHSKVVFSYDRGQDVDSPIGHEIAKLLTGC